MASISAVVDSSLRGRFKLTRVSLKVPGLPEAFQRYRIAHLTDLHFGPATRRIFIEEAFSLAQSLNPNLFVMTGDFVVAGLTGLRHKFATDVHPKMFAWAGYRRSVRRLTQELAEMIDELKADDGVFGCLGNHDHLEGLGTVLRQMPRSFRMLRNESLQLRKGGNALSLYGVDDTKRGKPDLRKTLEGHRDGFLRILLSHNPDIVLDENRALLHDVDLILCGHTHGGQIRIPGWGPIRTCTKQQEHVSGLSRFGETFIYTSSGVGHVGIPLRLFCPPEVVIFELEKAEDFS